MTALGLIVACRGTSEEFANGILNFICWPMMFLSEVWFSIEGAPAWIKVSANIFPVDTFVECGTQSDERGCRACGGDRRFLAILGIMTAAFLFIGSTLSFME
jgi:ABC-2 type transport system permease protein